MYSCVHLIIAFDFRFFQYAFACALSSIVAGTIAERTKMMAYLCYSIFLCGKCYFLAMHHSSESALTKTCLISCFTSRICLSSLRPRFLVIERLPLCFCRRTSLGIWCNRFCWFWACTHVWWRSSTRDGHHSGSQTRQIL